MSRVDPRATDVLDKARLKYQIDDNGDCRVLIGDLKDGRSQQVIVRSCTDKIHDLEYREIVSASHVGDIPEPKVMAYCLEQNCRVHYGSWQLQLNKRSEKAALVFGVNLSVNAGTAELVLVLSLVAQNADELEQKLSNEDRF